MKTGLSELKGNRYRDVYRQGICSLDFYSIYSFLFLLFNFPFASAMKSVLTVAVHLLILVLSLFHSIPRRAIVVKGA